MQLVGLEGGNVAKTFPPSFIFSNTQKEKYFLKNDFQNEITLLLGKLSWLILEQEILFNGRRVFLVSIC